jgi:sulfur-carrier protein
MAVKVRIPTQLRPLAGGQSELEVEGASSLRELLGKLGADYPGLTERILDETGEIRRFINVYAGDEDVRFLQGLDTSLEGVGLVSVLPAVAGGR